MKLLPKKLSLTGEESDGDQHAYPGQTQMEMTNMLVSHSSNA